MNRLKDKWILITGATSGIGRACAREFAASKSNLVLTGRRTKRLQDLKKIIENDYQTDVHIYSFDVQKRDECRTFYENLKVSIDILINNAGLALGKEAIYEADLNDWDTMIDTNIKGLLYMSRFFTQEMKSKNAGHVINIGSTAGQEAYAGGSVYCATKFAVNAITKATKLDLHGTDVRVSMVSPGLTETEFSNVRFKGDEDRADSVYKGMKPLTAADIAEIIHFVANRPPHVNILDTVIVPVDQSSSSQVNRS